MAFNFGDIRDQSSSAFWNDYDETREDDTPEINLEWKFHQEVDTKNLNVNILLIIEEHTMRQFIDTAILFDKTLIGEIVPNANIKKVRLYSVPNTNDVICVTEESDITKCPKLTELLAPWIQSANNVIAFTIQSEVFHKATLIYGGEQNGIYFRAINSKIQTIKALEIPNIVTGLSAGALTLRNHIGKMSSSSCYILFMDVIQISSDIAKVILKLIRTLGIPCKDSYNYVSKHSNLFM